MAIGASGQLARTTVFPPGDAYGLANPPSLLWEEPGRRSTCPSALSGDVRAAHEHLPEGVLWASTATATDSFDPGADSAA